MNVEVPCLCPPDGSRHPEGDTVRLRETLGFREAVTMQKSVSTLRLEVEDPSSAEILAALTEAYVLYGITDWSVLDERGKPLPCTRANITARLLSNLDAAMTVADQADDLYQAVVLLPLLKAGLKSSETSQTTDSTSPSTSSPPAPPTPLKRSSTTRSRTADTETTSESPDGGSNSLPSLASAV